MKTKWILFMLFFCIVMLATPLLASEVVPRFKFYSSVVYDPNKSIQSWDGAFTVTMPITTATPLTKQGELKYPTFDILQDVLTYPTFNIEPVQLSYPTFNIEPVTLTYPTYDIQKDTLQYPTYIIEPTNLEYPTYDLVDDALTCDTFSLVDDFMTCNTFNVVQKQVCQDVSYSTYEVGTEIIEVPYSYSYTAYVFDHSECLEGVILGIGWQCPEGGPYDNCCKKSGGSGNWTCYNFNPLPIQDPTDPACYPVYTEVTFNKDVMVSVEVPKATEITKSINVCADTTEAIPSSYPIAYQKAVSTTMPVAYKKAIPKTGLLESIKATPTMGSLDTIKAIPTAGSLDSIKATETTRTLESIKATPTTGTLDTIKAVPKTEIAAYEYSTFEVTEEEKLVDVYVDAPEDIDPPAVVTDTFVGTPNLEAKAWFFTRPRGGEYVTDIRVVRITGGHDVPVEREVLEAWRGINRIKKIYAGSERVELSKLVPTDQAGQIRIVFKAKAPNGDYRIRKVFINVWDNENPEANAALAEHLASIEEEE